MCHHRYFFIFTTLSHYFLSLPSIVTPIDNKKNLTRLMAADFSSVYVAYALLCTSALFAYGGITNPTCDSHPGPACAIQSLYTLNFRSFRNKKCILLVFLYLNRFSTSCYLFSLVSSVYSKYQFPSYCYYIA